MLLAATEQKRSFNLHRQCKQKNGKVLQDQENRGRFLWQGIAGEKQGKWQTDGCERNKYGKGECATLEMSFMTQYTCSEIMNRCAFDRNQKLRIDLYRSYII